MDLLTIQSATLSLSLTPLDSKSPGRTGLVQEDKGVKDAVIDRGGPG